MLERLLVRGLRSDGDSPLGIKRGLVYRHVYHVMLLNTRCTGTLTPERLVSVYRSQLGRAHVMPQQPHTVTILHTLFTQTSGCQLIN